MDDDQLALLATTYYAQIVRGAIGKLYGPDTPELARFNKLVGMVFVKIQRWNSSTNRDNYQEVVTTEAGLLGLRKHGPERIAQALLAAKEFTPLEYYVKMLPIKALPEFLTSDVVFIRAVARERYEELNG